jgi:hypothetical protein
VQGKIQYQFTAKIWKHSSTGSWYFVSLPRDLSGEIRKYLKGQEEGWGRMKARACISKIEWNTAIWFDKKRGTYLLPLKAEIRQKAKLKAGDDIKINLWL